MALRRTRRRHELPREASGPVVTPIPVSPPPSPVSRPSSWARSGATPPDRPVLRWDEGPRRGIWLVVLLSMPVVAFIVVAALAGGASALAARVGLASGDAVEATVVETRIRPGKPSGWKSGGLCAGRRISVSWGEGGRGYFVACDREARSELQVGDTVRVRPNPVGREVTPVGVATWWIEAILIGLVLALLWAARTSWDLRRLITTGPGGPAQAMTVRRIADNAAIVADDDGRGFGVDVLSGPIELGPATVWSTRRSLIRRRPAGPRVIVQPQGRGVAWLARPLLRHRHWQPQPPPPPAT